MRILAAILLVGLLLFNWVGYQVFYACLQDHSDRLVESRIDKMQYDEQELVTIKVPLHLPYFSDQQDFQREYGTITIKGVPYHYVKRKVYHDSLILVCLPNKEKLQLKAARNNYFKAVADIQASRSHKSKGGSSLFKNIFSDIALKINSWHLEGPDSGLSLAFGSTEQRYSFLFSGHPEQPPEA